MPDVFVSHATKDDAVVTEIHDALEKRSGVEIWVDHKDIRPGENWQARIEQALKDCPYLLVIISRHSVASDEVTAEWRAALTYNHALLLLIIDDVPVEDIPARLRLHQWLDWNKDRDGALDKLAAAITGGAVPGATAEVSFTRSAGIINGESIDTRLTTIPLVGRAEDLTEVQSLLGKGQPVSLLAYGGSGKSRLAYEIARQEERGALWHICDEFSEPYEIIDGLRTYFRLEETAKEADVLRQLRTYRRLLIIDNAESIGEDDPRRAHYVALVQKLVQCGAPVLLTSRVRWQELKAARFHDLGTLSPADATRVVDKMAERSGVDTRGQSAEIATACRCHPRLIEWAVALLEEFPLTKVLADLNALRGETVEEALDEMIHQTARQMTAAHGDAALALLRRLNVMRGTFTYEAAQAVSLPGQAATPNTVSHLNPQPGAPPADPTALPDADTFDHLLPVVLRYRLLRFDGERYSIDDLVRECLGTDEAAHAPHFAYFEYVHGDYNRNNDEDHHPAITADFENIRAALAWGLTAEPRRACDFVVALDYYLALRDSLATRRELLTMGYQAARDSTYDLGQANTLRRLGDLCVREDDLVAGRDYYQLALPTYEAIENRLGQANTLRALGDLSLHEDDLAAARVYYERALPLYEALGDRLGQANTLRKLGDLSLREDALAAARDYYEQALSIYETIGARLGQAHTLIALGELSQREDALAAARDYYERGLSIYETIGDRLGQANTFTSLGDLLHLETDYQAAISAYSQALELAQQIGDQYTASKALIYSAPTLVALGEYESALRASLSALIYFAEKIPAAARVAISRLRTLRQQMGADTFDDLWRKLTGDEPPEWLL